MATKKPIVSIHADLDGAKPQEGVQAQELGSASQEGGAKTMPGKTLGNALEKKSALLLENEELKERVGLLESQDAVQKIDPALIDASRWANRDEANFSDADPDFQALKAEIESAGGNVQPIKVRPAGDRFEIVFGHRRHRACLQLGLKVQAIVESMDDQQLFAEMDRENRARKNLSPYEQGVMYRQALDARLFPSNSKLAAAIGVDLPGVGKAIALASLPEFVVKAFPSPLDLQFRWAKPLKDALEENRGAVQERAKKIAATPDKRLSAADVFSILVGEKTAGGLDRPTPPAKDTLVSVNGKKFATLSSDKNGKTRVIFDEDIGAEKLKKLAQFLVQLGKN